MASTSTTTTLPSTLSLQTSLLYSKTKHPFSSFTFINNNPRPFLGCSAKKKIGFFDQILDYIEGGPKLRKWYGAPDLLPKDGSDADEADDYQEENEVRDAVLVTDGDGEIGQMVILQLIVKRTRVKAFVKDKRMATEAFGDYVESLTGDPSNKQFLNKALRGVRAIICPSEGFLSNVGSLKGVKHVILLSRLSALKGTGGIEALMKGNAKKLAEQDESMLSSAGIPYTIIRTSVLQDTPGGKQGFCFNEGSAATGSLSKEDAAMICVEALNVVPEAGFAFEVSNGEEKVQDWSERLAKLMNKASS